MRRLLGPGMALVLMSGCATAPFERHVQAGRWVDALHLFEQDSALQAQPGAMFNAALLYASPDLDSWQPAEARRLFARVYELQPGTSRGESARRFMMLLDAMERSRIQLEFRQQLLLRERAELAERIDSLRTERDAARAQVVVLTRQDSVVSADLARMEATLRARDLELASLRDELERLKAIDLRPVQRPAGGNGGSDGYR